MRFHSILFDRGGQDTEPAEEPAFFDDLHLDRILSSLVAGREEYDLAPFFYRPLHDVEAVRYRHHVLLDLELDAVLEGVRAFAHRIQRMREHLALAEKLHYGRQKQRWFLEAVAVYCDAIGALNEQFARLELRSRGFAGVRDYVASYAESDGFTSLVTDAHALKEELAAVRYAVHIKGNRVRVSRYEGEPDLSAEVEQTFARFKQGAVKDYRVRFREHPDMNHVEGQILELVARLHSEAFSRLMRSACNISGISTRRSPGSTVRCSSTSHTSSTSNR